MSKRNKYSAEFKAKVALEALAGELTMAQLATKHGVHPTMIAQWKAKAKEGLIDVFANGKGRKAKSGEDDVEKLHAKIGQLTMERDFLSKAFGR